MQEALTFFLLLIVVVEFKKILSITINNNSNNNNNNNDKIIYEIALGNFIDKDKRIFQLRSMIDVAVYHGHGQKEINTEIVFGKINSRIQELELDFEKMDREEKKYYIYYK